MKRCIYLLGVFCLLAFPAFSQQGGETITISGRVTDFDGRPIDGSDVTIVSRSFEALYAAVTDSAGFYRIGGVEKGKYTAIMAMRPEEYPRPPRVPEEDMRLEFWGWNVIADRDLAIDIRYHRLELYGFTVFRFDGGYPGMMAYVRPMSLGELLASESDAVKTDKSVLEKELDISVRPEDIEFQIWADGQPLKINSVQQVKEYVGGGTQYGYFIQMERPSGPTDKPYRIFRIEGLDKKYNERGESIYFYEINDNR